MGVIIIRKLAIVIYTVSWVALTMILLYHQSLAMNTRDNNIVKLSTICSKYEYIVDKQSEVINTQRKVIAKLTGGGKLIRMDRGTFECTAYESGPQSCGKWADGMTSEMVPAGLGIAAADHSVLPPGTILYVHKLGTYYVVLDRGGAIVGNRLDLYTTNVANAMILGRFESSINILNMNRLRRNG